jgi:hypothetical protein
MMVRFAREHQRRPRKAKGIPDSRYAHGMAEAPTAEEERLGRGDGLAA